MQANKINIKAKDGVDIQAVTFNVGEESVKGIVMVVHGFGEHAGSYNEIIETLVNANYACVIFDQRGHGLADLPPKKRAKLLGIIPSYKCFLDDVEAVAAEMKRLSPGTPLVLYGHSMGGNVAANYLLKVDQAGFSCAVLESPWLGLYQKVSPLVSGTAKILGGVSRKFAINNPLSYDDITNDKEKAKEIEHDPLYHNRISFRMFAGINKGCKYAVKNAPKLSAPTYLAYASNERVVSNQAIRKFHGKCGQNVIIKEYTSNHAIHNDENKESFYKDMIAFLDEHCAARG